MCCRVAIVVCSCQHCIYGSCLCQQYTDSTGSTYNLPEQRVRSWNGYLLFYERVDVAGIDGVGAAEPGPPPNPDAVPTEGSASLPHAESIPTTSSASPQHAGAAVADAQDVRDAATRATEAGMLTAHANLLVHRGKELFAEAEVGTVAREVHELNVQFIHESHIFSEDYFQFLFDLGRQDIHVRSNPDVAVAATRLITKFVLNTFLRVDQTVRKDWAAVVFLEPLFRQSVAAIEAFAEVVLSDPNTLDGFLLQAPDVSVRQGLAACICMAVECYVAHGGDVGPSSQQLLSALFSMLNSTTIVNHTDRTAELFRLYRDLLDVDVRRGSFQIIVRGDAVCRRISRANTHMYAHARTEAPHAVPYVDQRHTHKRHTRTIDTHTHTHTNKVHTVTESSFH